MADDTQNLAITITATDSGAASLLADVRTKISAIEAELGSMGAAGSAAGDSVAAGATAASGGLTKAAGATEELNLSLKQLEGHAGTVARGLGAMDLAAAGAAARVEGLVGAVVEMEAAAPALLAVAGALTAIFAGFEFLKSGIEDAEKLQQSMVQLGIAVQAQGGNWETASEQVTKWSEALELAAGIAANESVASLNRLVEAGASVHDGMAELSVGAQMVAAGMGDWERVTTALTQAQGNNFMQLGRLDPAVRQLIKDHADLSTVMQAINKQTTDAIEKNNTLALNTARLHAEIAAAGTSIGTEMLPMLVGLSVMLQVVVHDAIAASSGFVQFANGVVQSIGSADKAMFDFAKGMMDVVSFNWKGAVGDFQAGGHEVVAGSKAMQSAIHGFGDAYSAVAHGVSTYSKDMAAAMAAVKKAAAGVGQLDNNPIAGTLPKGKGAGSGYEPSDALIAPQNTQLASNALNEYNTSLKAVTEATKALAATVDTSMTSDTQKAQHFAQLAQAADQARAQMATLIPTIQSERSAIESSTQSMAQKYAAYKESTTALNALENSLKDHTKISQADKDAIDAAKNSQREAEQAWKESETTVSNLSSTLSKHVTQLTADTKAVQENTNAQDDAYKQYNDAVAKANEGLEAEEATYKKSLSQQLQYWQQKLAVAQAGGQAMLADAASDYAKITEIETSFYKQSVDQYDEMLKKETEEQEKFVDDFIDGTGTLKDRLKKVWDDILNDFDKMIEQMIFKSNGATSGGSGGLFGNIFSAIFGGGANGSANDGGIPGMGGASSGSWGATTTGAATAASQYGVLGAIVGADGASSVVSSLPTNAGMAGVFIGANGSETAAAASISPFDTASQGVYQPQGGWDESTGIDAIGGGSSFGGGFSIPGGASAGAQSTAADVNGILQGAAIGGGVAGMTGENQTWGSVGGALLGGAGTVIGTIFGGPVGGAIGGAVGGLIGGLVGGLFGPHWNPQDEPDVNEPVVNGVNYGTFVADMTGHPGTFNGQVIDPQAPYNVPGGGTNEMTDLQSALANALKDPNASASLKALTAQLQALEGGDTTNGLGIASEKNDMFTLNSGQQVNVEQYMALVSNFMSQAASIVPSFSLTRTYPNYNKAHLHGEIATPPPGTTPPPTGTTPPPTGGGPTYPGHGPGTGTAPYIDLRGAMIVGPGGLAEAANTIAAALQRAQQGQLPGSYANASSLSGVAPKRRFAT